MILPGTTLKKFSKPSKTSDYNNYDRCNDTRVTHHISNLNPLTLRLRSYHRKQKLVQSPMKSVFSTDVCTASVIQMTSNLPNNFVFESTVKHVDIDTKNEYDFLLV